MSRCKTFLYSSSSKHDGLAGTRFGWGLIKDMDLATRMSVTLDIVVLGLSVDAELRVLTSLQTILSKPIVCVGGRGGGGGGIILWKAEQTGVVSGLTHSCTCLCHVLCIVVEKPRGETYSTYHTPGVTTLLQYFGLMLCTCR